MTKASEFAWAAQHVGKCGVRECFSRLCDALNTLQKEVSLFLLLDVMQLTVNVIAFLAYVVINGLQKSRSLTFLVVFIDALIRIIVLTFSCGQVTKEVKKMAFENCLIVSVLLSKGGEYS